MSLPRSVRLILDDPAEGAWNMGADEALAMSAAVDGRTTLRFYGWSPATLSLGYFQGLSERAGHVASLPCPVVRRGTGGGAIVHDRELTYSFACPATIGSHGAAEELYDLFHDTLRETLISLGLPATRQAETERELDGEFLCFSRRSRGDLLCGDFKIVGSAQRRVRGALLQHGSVLLARSDFAPELPGIAELAGVTLSPAGLASAWTARLTAAADWALATSEWTASELTAAGAEAERYAADRWTAKRA